MAVKILLIVMMPKFCYNGGSLEYAIGCEKFPKEQYGPPAIKHKSVDEDLYIRL